MPEILWPLSRWSWCLRGPFSFPLSSSLFLPLPFLPCGRSIDNGAVLSFWNILKPQKELQGTGNLAAWEPFPAWQPSTVPSTAIRSHWEKYSEEQGLFLPKQPKAHHSLGDCWSPVCVKMADFPEQSLRVSFPKNCKASSYWTSETTYTVVILWDWLPGKLRAMFGASDR